MFCFEWNPVWHLIEIQIHSHRWRSLLSRSETLQKSKEPTSSIFFPSSHSYLCRGRRRCSSLRCVVCIVSESRAIVFFAAAAAPAPSHKKTLPNYRNREPSRPLVSEQEVNANKSSLRRRSQQGAAEWNGVFICMCVCVFWLVRRRQVLRVCEWVCECVCSLGSWSSQEVEKREWLWSKSIPRLCPKSQIEEINMKVKWKPFIQFPSIPFWFRLTKKCYVVWFWTIRYRLIIYKQGVLPLSLCVSVRHFFLWTLGILACRGDYYCCCGFAEELYRFRWIHFSPHVTRELEESQPDIHIHIHANKVTKRTHRHSTGA